MNTNASGPVGSDSSEGLGPAAWAVMAFGRVQKLIVRADVADEETCKWREMDPGATAVPLYTWATVEAQMAGERERCAKLCEDISDEYQSREGHRYPELRSDAQEGASKCADAIRGA